MFEGTLWSAAHPLHSSTQAAHRAAQRWAGRGPRDTARRRLAPLRRSLPARLRPERPAARRQALLLAVRLWVRLPAELAAACALLPGRAPPPPPDFFTAGARRGEHAAPDAAAAFFARAHLQARRRACAAQPAAAGQAVSVRFRVEFCTPGAAAGCAMVRGQRALILLTSISALAAGGRAAARPRRAGRMGPL